MPDLSQELDYSFMHDFCLSYHWTLLTFLGITNVTFILLILDHSPLSLQDLERMVEDNGGIREKEPFSLSKAKYREVGSKVFSLPLFLFPFVFLIVSVGFTDGVNLIYKNLWLELFTLSLGHPIVWAIFWEWFCWSLFFFCLSFDGP